MSQHHGVMQHVVRHFRAVDERYKSAFIDSGQIDLPPMEKRVPLRRKLWDLESKHHCPVIGTCLTLDELVRFARRFGFSESSYDEYALHVEAVGLAGSKNVVSEAIHKHLDKKYDRYRKQYEKIKSDAQLFRQWKLALAEGEVAGPMWAVLTHKLASAETRQTVYTDVHMLSHQVGAGQAADARRLLHLEKENTQLKQALRKQQREHANTMESLQKRLKHQDGQMIRLEMAEKELDKFRQQQAASESDVARQARERQLSSLQAENSRLSQMANRSETLSAELNALQQRFDDLLYEHKQVIEERALLEELFGTQEADDSVTPDPCKGCNQMATQRCVLCVGGRTSLLSQYRGMAERLGIRLVHHDGGLEESITRLPELINASDAVICPTDCVSHSAYYQIKKHCKRIGKPCLLYRGAGVSSFAMALKRLNRGDVNIKTAY